MTVTNADRFPLPIPPILTHSFNIDEEEKKIQIQKEIENKSDYLHTCLSFVSNPRMVNCGSSVSNTPSTGVGCQYIRTSDIV